MLDKFSKNNFSAIEDEVGILICYQFDTQYYLDKYAHLGATVIYQGTKEEVEKYLGIEITQWNITFPTR